MVTRFKEVFERSEDSDGSESDAPEFENRVQKEAYVCKRMKLTRNQLYELCLCTGIDTLYSECRKNGGRR